MEKSHLWGEESDLDYGKRFNPFEVDPGGVGEVKEVMVDSEQAVKKKKSASNEKAIVALKNHSEAERRRRERINGHFATLEDLLPSNEKMDKATLLAEVINQVKDLHEHARQVSKGLLMPMDTDELIVEPLFRESQNGVITIEASLCCDFRPDLFSDLKQAIGALKLRTQHSEISTLGNRVKTRFILSGRNEQNLINNADAHRNLVNAILQALSSVLRKPPPLPEYSLRTTLSHKRFRTSLDDYSPQSVLPHKRFKYSSSSSSG